jgi:hypothetical protein
MSNFTKWNDSFQERANSDKPLHAILFVARNKDNRDLPNFKERREVFLTTQPEDSPILKQKFLEFAKRSQKNELSRLYISLNARDQQKTRISFMHYFFDHSDQINMAGLPAIAAKLAMNRKNAVEKKRMFDVDTKDKNILKAFIADLTKQVMRSKTTNAIIIHSTIHGFAVVIERGIDLRNLVDTMSDAKLCDKKDKGPWKWPKDLITYKQDDFVLLKWYRQTKEPYNNEL